MLNSSNQIRLYPCEVIPVHRLMTSSGPILDATENDEKFMREAIRQARKGLGRTSPNPPVVMESMARLPRNTPFS